MAWDSLAQRVMVNAIGTVESNNRWDAIYYSDPITVGFMQWFGPRAVNILNRMLRESPASMAGMAASLRSWLGRGGPGAGSRYLTRAEGESIRGGLRANANVQVKQALEDFESYAATAAALGLSREKNTQTYIMFCVAYHQSPARARRLLRAIGPSSSVDRLHAALLNEPVFGRYRNRYNTSYRIIKSMNPGNIKLDGNVAPAPSPGNNGPVVDDGDGVGGQDLDGDGIPDVTERQDGGIGYIESHGNRLLVRMRDGKNHWATLTNGGIYVVNAALSGADVPSSPDDTGVAPENPGGGGGGGGGDSSKAARIVKWMADRKGKFYYTNGSDRWDPDRTGGGDCSSTIRRAYLDVAGIDIGSRSFDIARRGREVQSGRGPRGWDVSKWHAADVVCMGLNYARSYSSSGISHVELYTGDGVHSWGHGGGAGGRTKGPTYNNLFSKGYLGSATVWTVRRFL